MSTQHFQTTLAQTGSRIWIAIPFDPNAVWGVKQRHHITGHINGCAVRGSLGVKDKQYFLPLGAAWRRGSGLQVGDTVDVTLSPEGPQLQSLSPDVALALDAAPKAKAFFEGLATFYRNTYIKWIESAKRPETRQARIREMVTLLKAGQKQK